MMMKNETYWYQSMKDFCLRIVELPLIQGTRPRALHSLAPAIQNARLEERWHNLGAEWAKVEC